MRGSTAKDDISSLLSTTLELRCARTGERTTSPYLRYMKLAAQQHHPYPVICLGRPRLPSQAPLYAKIAVLRPLVASASRRRKGIDRIGRWKGPTSISAIQSTLKLQCTQFLCVYARLSTSPSTLNLQCKIAKSQHRQSEQHTCRPIITPYYCSVREGDLEVAPASPAYN